MLQESFLVFKACFKQKKILIISDKNIINIPITSRQQVVMASMALVAMLWMSYSTGKYFTYESVISEKNNINITI